LIESRIKSYIVFGVGLLSKFMEKPRMYHFKEVKLFYDFKGILTE